MSKYTTDSESESDSLSYYDELSQHYTFDCKENNVVCDCYCYKSACHCDVKYIPQKKIYDVATKMIENDQIALCYVFGNGPFTFNDNCGDEDDVFVCLYGSDINLDRKYGHNFEKILRLGSNEKGWYDTLVVVTRCHH